MKDNQLKYRFYATLLDSFQNYLKSDEIYSMYWGGNENPPFTFEEFEKKQYQNLIDRINRVPMNWEDSEKADKGTAFNEIVDCIIDKRKSDKMQIESDKETGIIKAQYNEREFVFPISLCREFADYYKGATTQILTEAVLPTHYGNVLLYGYIDELMPKSIHDIKTTGMYSAGKFKDHFQHYVYPYCLRLNGNDVSDFEYNVAVIKETKKAINYETFTEFYSFVPERDIPILTAFVEQLIEFIEANKHLITDKKIFNKHLENA